MQVRYRAERLLRSRCAAPIPSHTRGPTSSWLPGRSGCGRFRIERQLPIDFPCDIRELHHRDRNIADGNGGVELLTFADSRNKIREVSIRHGITTEDVGGRGSAADFEFARLFTVDVVDLVTVAIDKDGTGGPHDG